MKMPKVLDCNATECAYNKDKKCHAMAITVGDCEPMCDTYISSPPEKAGVRGTGGVGACKVSRCRFNTNLECTADGIHVKLHADHAECRTFAEK